MRCLKKDLAQGFLHLRIDNLDDLWALRSLIQPGDLATASTTRTAEQADDKIRSEKAEKKRMTLGIRVEGVEWHDFDDHLRVHGLIEAGPQDLGRHHTLVLRDDGNDVKIQKPGRLAKWQRDMVAQAEADSKRPRVLLLAIDDSEAQFGQLAGFGLRLLGTLPASGQGKGYDGKGAQAAKQGFWNEVIKSLKALREDAQAPLLIVGPGWWREEFIEYARQKAPDLVAGAKTDGVSQGGKAGLQEALRRGLLDQVARDHRVQQETEWVEEVFTRIAKNDGLVAYGPADVENAARAGAADTVLLTDDAARTGRHLAVVAAAEAMRCPVHIVSTSHDAGERLERMGGTAALLRFALG